MGAQHLAERLLALLYHMALLLGATWRAQQ
jgi:hypothetical protein